LNSGSRDENMIQVEFVFCLRLTPIQVKKQKKRGLDTLSRQIAPNLKFELFSEFLIFHGLGGRFFGTFSNFLSVKELL
jgi:hypothetical protein